MNILGLTVLNFGVFRGRHHFDFAPALSPEGTRQHLVSVIGANGVGKSTLFQAMSLALHGALSLSDRVSRQDYQKYLLGRLHRSSDLGVAVSSNEAFVGLDFDYVRSGRRLRVEVKRHWYLEGGKISEELTVLCNGQRPDVPHEDVQHWLNELVPPGLSSLCFFDAERLDDFAGVGQPEGFVRDALHRLLGLDLVEKLLADLDRYSTLRGGGSADIEGLRRQAQERRGKIDEIKVEIENLHAEISAFDGEAERLGAELAAQEGRLAAEGGTYAERRQAIQAELTRNRLEAERVAAQIEALCHDLLPFCLAPGLCRQLEQRLLAEASLLRQAATDDEWMERGEALRLRLKSEKLWRGLELSTQARETLTRRLLKELEKSFAPQAAAAQPIIHDLAAPERERLLSWIRQTLDSIPAQVKQLGGELRTLQQEQQQLRQDLKRAPDDVALQPIQREIERLQGELQKLHSQRNACREQIGSRQYQLEEQERQYLRLEEQLSQARANEQRLALAERSRKTLLGYKENLLHRRVASLRANFLINFNRLCRKEHLLSAVVIDPQTFRIELLGEDGRSLKVSELSAGERQLYALAWLQSLRQVSGRQLPLVIDTPLARLDEQHRARLVNNYFAEASEQVLLFATTAELDADLLLELKPMLVRLYELRQDAGARESYARCFSAPQPRELLLYRAEANGQPGGKSDASHTGTEQYWHYDPDVAAAGGRRLLKASLPATARRLEVIDPESGGYNWLQVAELAHAVEDKFLFAALRSGRQIFDIWHDEWSSRLLSAGYDSVAVFNIEGPIECVLNESKLHLLNGSAGGGH